MSIEMNYFVEFLDLVRGSRVASFRSNFLLILKQGKNVEDFHLINLYQKYPFSIFVFYKIGDISFATPELYQ